MSEYILARAGKRTALYRDGALKATWTDEIRIDNKAYIDSQVAMWVGVSGDPVTEVDFDGKVFPEDAKDLKPQEKPNVKNKRSVADEAKGAEAV
jgi:hypothetical protein